MEFKVSCHMQISSKSGEEEGLQTLLDSITSQTCPSGQHAAYHAKHLELLLRQMESQPARFGVKSILTSHKIVE